MKKRAKLRAAIEAIESRLLLTTVYVDVNAPEPTHDGSSWGTAFNDLQQGLAAAVSGDQIHVADGTYKPTRTTSRSATFQLKNGVSLLGGYPGYGATDPDARDVVHNPSILSGDIGVQGSTTDNCYHVVTGGGTYTTTILDGFTISDGNANGTTSATRYGGGMYNYQSSPTVTNCTFSGNSAKYSGGGIYNYYSSPTVTNCTLNGNSATNYGGGIYDYYSSPIVIGCVLNGNSGGSGGGIYNDVYSLPMLTDCTFNANSAGQGAGEYDNAYTSPILTDCTFSMNSSNGSGGGMLSNSSSTLTNCTFSGNLAESDGGGMCSYASSSVTNCTFSENSAGIDGGGFANFSPSTLSQCIFSRNSAESDGGGMYSSSSAPILTACTFTENSAGQGGGMWTESPTATLTGCIFRGNEGYSGAGIYSYEHASLILTNCTFVENSASSSSGGGIANGNYASPTLTNCTFTGNSAFYSGGAIYCGSNCRPNLTNCTLSGNSAGLSGGAMYTNYASPMLTNCVVWGNTASGSPQIYQSNGTASISYSDVQDGWSGVGNIAASPQFVRNPSPGADGNWGTADDDYGDLRLRASSPAADAGNNAVVPVGVGTDLGGANRFVDIPTTEDTGAGTSPIVDMGAYEAKPSLASDAGGAYVVFAGRGISLSGSGASDAAGPLQYDWEWTGDGLFDDATGPTPIFSTAGIPVGSVITIGLRVTDSTFRSIISTTSLRIAPRVAYVDSRAIGVNNGASWNDAFSSLATALNLSIAGQTVEVAGGTYKPTSGTNRDASFGLNTGMAVFGGYAGLGSGEPNVRNIGAYVTILSGDIGAIGDTGDNSYHVVVTSGTDATTVLDGFTITGGNANANGVGGLTSQGGGLLNFTSSPTIRNCTFTGNSSCSYGGGLYSSGSSSPILVNCAFSRNSSLQGGGMYNDSYSSLVLVGCSFSGNLGAYGGAIYTRPSSSLTLVNCALCGNAASYGGGIYSDYSSQNLTNCTLAGNSAVYSGGAVYEGNGSKFVNCIISGNTGSANSQIYASGGITITYSDIEGGFAGAGNIATDPEFVRNPNPGADGVWGTTDDDYGDLRLLASSPAADAGNNNAVPAGTTTDLAGNNRFMDVPTTADTGSGTSPIVDMGAYEAIPALAADAGGPFAVLPGHSVALSGRGASDVAGTLQYDWEWTGDGLFDDATGPNPVFSTAGLPAGSVISISLRVTDSASRSIISTTSLRIAPVIVYVDSRATGANNGTSWSDAFSSLATALNLSIAGQMVEVAGGTYKPTSGTDRNQSFVLKSGVGVYGGYAGLGARDPNMRNISPYVTVLSGDIGMIGDTSDNSYHVVVASGTDATTVLDGFTITGGNANARDQSGKFGGGIYNDSGGPVISNCLITENRAEYSGGGILNSGYRLVTMVNCTFIRNSALNGGAMMNSSGPIKVVSCAFYGNSADDGGAIYNASGLVNCTFSGNSASEGGAIFNAAGSVTDCTFTGNSGYGGGIYNDGSSPIIRNCIFWNNTGSQIYDAYSGHSIVEYCDIQGGFNGTTLITADPQFVRNPSPGADGVWGTADDDYGDLRLRISSPCIDAGADGMVPAGITTDLAGNPRFVDVPGVRDLGVVVDMGAYERVAPFADAAFLLDAAKPAISVTFGADIPPGSLTSSDLALTNRTTGLSIDCGSAATVSYDPATRTASWVFPGLLPDGDYRAVLPAGSVTDAQGDSVLVCDLTFDFFTLAGDANHDRMVDVRDLSILVANWGGSGKVFSQGDFNYDGRVDVADLTILAQNWQKTLDPLITVVPRPAKRTPAKMVALVL